MARRTMSRRVVSASPRKTRSKSRVVCIDTTIRLYEPLVKRGAQRRLRRQQIGVQAGSSPRALYHAGGPCADSPVLAADGLEEVHHELVDPLGGIGLHPVAGFRDPLDPHLRDPGAVRLIQLPPPISTLFP